MKTTLYALMMVNCTVASLTKNPIPFAIGMACGLTAIAIETVQLFRVLRRTSKLIKK